MAQPKRARGGRKRKPLKELGMHPEDKEPVSVFKGPHGHYVKHNDVNAALPEGETVESITLEVALALIADKAGGKKKTTKKKATTRKKTTAKKKTTTAKKTTKKKAAK